jgi:hypothetical protein
MYHYGSVPDSYVFGPPGSASGSVSHKDGSGSGSFPFLIKVLSGLEKMVAKLNFNTKIVLLKI